MAARRCTEREDHGRQRLHGRTVAGRSSRRRSRQGVAGVPAARRHRAARPPHGDECRCRAADRRSPSASRARSAASSRRPSPTATSRSRARAAARPFPAPPASTRSTFSLVRRATSSAISGATACAASSCSTAISRTAGRRSRASISACASCAATASPTCRCCASNTGTSSRRDTLDRLFPDGFPGTELEHASLLETSLMLLLRPDLVDMGKVPSDGPAKFPTYDRGPRARRFRPAAVRRAGAWPRAPPPRRAAG